MKRRQFFHYTGAGLGAAIATIAASKWQPAQAQSNSSLTVQWLGHTCFLFTGGGRRILTNPFLPLGCTAGYRKPQVASDLVMISSRLLDEGVTEGLLGNPRVLSESGIFEFTGMQVQGIRTAHDDLGGRRFGDNIVWRWNQGGLVVVHLGGAAAPITVEEQILMGRPDVLLLPVGNGVKAFTPEEARDTVQKLNPKVVIPTHYRTQAADEAACDILPLDNFLSLMEGTPVQRSANDSITLRSTDLPASGAKIQILTYRF